jgi:L,D-peptidoglycan transpeptidase YkuD (ErfK/YbiS/YcfS/YnhG family)
MKGATLFLVAGLLLVSIARADQQLVVAIAPDVNSHNGALQLYHRDSSGQWHADDQPWPVLFGSHGLAWGSGLQPEQKGPKKREGDRRSPAGRFRIGFAFGPDKSLPPGAHNWPYQMVTEHDAWIDDPKLPHYNHLITVKPGEEQPWFQKEKIKPLDPAYHWCILIEYNYPDAVPGAGSAIFFHIRRGLDVPTSGCTTMSAEKIEKLVRWLDPASKPEFVLLTWADYKRVAQDWKLPPLSMVAPMMP